MVYTDVLVDAVGTPHHKATCCWCGGPLVVGAVVGTRCWLCAREGCWRRQVAGAVIVTVEAGRARALGVEAGRRCLNVPLPSQVYGGEGRPRNLLVGGQAGPGKSHGVRWLLYQEALTIPGHTALLLRETHDELRKTHLREMEREVPLLGGVFRQGPPAQAYFPATGAYIDCGHMSDAAAVRHHLGTNYGTIVAEEGAQYPLTEDGVSPLGELSTRAREVTRDRDGRVVAPLFLVASNPGGPSSSFLLDFFIDHTPDFEVYPALRGVYDPARYVYRPASLDDNPYMDPEYESLTLAVLPKWRHRQLRHGDWHAFAGQFFSQWRGDHHVRDWGTPSGARWFRSMDWGYLAPGCVLWWAVLPDGRLYIRDDEKFQQADETEVAATIKARDRRFGLKGVDYMAADPAMWHRTGSTHRARGFVGQSIAETLAHYGVPAVPADHDRVNGWKRLQGVLRDAADGVPWLVVHPDARYLIRTVPAARSDRGNPEDVDTTGDDHALDSARYGVQTRPTAAMTTTKRAYPRGSAGDLREQVRRETRASRRRGAIA